MAQASEILAQSQLEDASVSLIYDDVTLIGSAVQVSVGATATGPMTVNLSTASGFSGTFVVQPNRFNQIFNIPVNRRPQGVMVTSRSGMQTINWGLSVSISFNG